MHTVNNFITMVNLKSCRQDKKKSSHLIINNLLWRVPNFSIHACFPKCRFYWRQLFNAVKSGCKKILWFTYFHSLLFDCFFFFSYIQSQQWNNQNALTWASSRRADSHTLSPSPSNSFADASLHLSTSAVAAVVLLTLTLCWKQSCWD